MPVLEPVLWKQLGEASDFKAFCDSWLALQCGLIGNVAGGLVVAGQDLAGTPLAVRPPNWTAFWLADAIRLAAEQQRGVAHYDHSGPEATSDGQRAGFAFPVIVDGKLCAVAAIELHGTSESQARAAMRQLQWGVAGLREYLLRAGRDATAQQEHQARNALDMLSVVLEQERFGAACRSFVTELAARFKCERVSIGFVKAGHAEVAAISHSAQFGRHMNLVRLVGVAMDEALDQRALILHPPSSDELNVTRSHAELAQSCGAVAVLTIPLFVSDRFIGAITFERAVDVGFDAATIAVLDGIAATAGPILEEKRRNDRWLIVKAGEASWSLITSLLGPHYAARKLAVVVAVMLAAIGYFWTGLYRVTADAVVEGRIQRSVVAPFNGFVLEAQARAGDTVHAGQILARLDDRDLILERLKWITERQRKVLEFEKAMGDRNRAEQKISTTQIEQADAQIHLVDEQLSRARLTAPFDGLIIAGDLTQSIGASLQRGQELFQVAPLDSYRVVLDIDETQIAEIALDQKGQLVVSSLPAENFPLVVSKITPVSRAHDGRNSFKVEARLTDTPAGLRPGMRGVGKIDINQRRMVWIWTRSFLDWALLTAWRWFG
ncbi:HlyD family efflux transporter periplasmic adaptor subunit [Bradyrhizobium sp.]|uniref:HlyD family efflux transporter periplasmic adaptor subunit n=1 Tax=Bradyrhizobium sp. TaxID=376 RepID=UPI00271E04FE|nr:HlyD family efflux transporter periplasmic adaptor subunit [Bradyrhizobium sp.]MDO9297064.1 efflux RND transporter periplasmic adaptor subunit [Bradyrhizobium sp.]